MGLQEVARKLKEKWRRFFETVDKPVCCVFCQGSKVFWNGSRDRTASVKVEAEDESGVVHLTDVACRRAKCGTKGCRRSWTLRPPGLFPRRHYQLCVVASGTSEYLFEAKASLTSVAQRCSCSRHTVGRWLTWESEVANPCDLQRHLLEVSGEPLVLKERPVADLAHKAVNAVGRRILTAAAQVLVLLEALGVAVGYEPPGLRSVIEAVVNDRDRVTTYASPSVPDFGRRSLAWPVRRYAM
jgi:hypothetical protein